MNIAELKMAIEEAEEKIKQYQLLIPKVNAAATHLSDSNTNLTKSGELLSTGFVVNSVPADGGAISSISTDINKSMQKFNEVSSLAGKKVIQLRQDITYYQKEIQRLERIERERRAALAAANKKENNKPTAIKRKLDRLR